MRKELLVGLLAALLVMTAPAAAAPTPKPTPHVTLHYPTVPLHTEVVVEVNNKGQVVRVKSTKPSKNTSFNLQTYGNALQMWIRHPNGSAQTGLYRITYDYDPKTQNVKRSIAIISKGGDWANSEGAANVMMDMARKQSAAAAEAQRKAQQLQQQQNEKLPSLNQIRGAPTPKPTQAATLPP